MTTRYSVVFAAEVVEPDERGPWVKYEDYERLELLEQSESSQLFKITQAHRRLETELHQLQKDKGAVIEKLHARLQAAEDRLEQIHVHAPNCASRYSYTVLGGQITTRECNCSLMQEAMNA